MKATPTHGNQAPSSAHGTARTAASSNRDTYLHDTPAVHLVVPGQAKARQVFKLTTYRTVQDAVLVTRIALEAHVPSELRLADQPPPRLSIGSSGIAVRRPLDPTSIASVTRITVGASLNCQSPYSSVSHHLSVLRPTYGPDLGRA